MQTIPEFALFVDINGAHSLLSAELTLTVLPGGSSMFCTQCGTQVDQGKNFCKNCGARVGQGNAAIPMEPAEPEPSAAVAQQPEVATSPSRQPVRPAPVAPTIKEGKSNKTVLIAAGVALVALAGAGVFFASGLFKAEDVPSMPPPPPVQESMAKAPEDNAPVPSFEETKDPPLPGEGPSASANPPLSPEPPPVAETAKAAPPESIRKTAPTPETLPPPAKSQAPRATPDAGRSNRPTPSGRGGANPGIYETVRGTTVYEDPSASAKVLANIPAGVRVNVVSSNGDWLEVHSKRGNPPGFIRRGDATFVEAGN